MEAVFTTLFRQKIALVAAGRTDTGVHARKMVAHFDIDVLKGTAGLVHRLNSFLPGDIAVHKIFEVPPDMHARFHATERTYEYWIVTRKDPFYKDAAWYLNKPLNLEAMNEAAALLSEFEDFESFSKSGSDVKTYHCRIKEAYWNLESHKIVFTITADRFLRNMVRAIVGTLIEVGQEKIAVEDVKTIIKSRDRGQAGVSVPAKGLYLTRIEYPDKWVK